MGYPEDAGLGHVVTVVTHPELDYIRAALIRIQTELDIEQEFNGFTADVRILVDYVQKQLKNLEAKQWLSREIGE